MELMPGYMEQQQVDQMTTRSRLDSHLTNLGFGVGRGGTHTARTMMLKELRVLLLYVGRHDATTSDYLSAIEDDNCLGKRSQKNRILTYRHLAALYSLDPSNIVFRALLFFWDRDPTAQPLLALLCSVARDPVLRTTTSFILSVSEGTTVAREEMEEFINDVETGRFSKATLKSTAQNINSTWTQAGHLTGRALKVRSHANPTSASVAYALLLGYLTGVRGAFLLDTEYAKLLDCPPQALVEFAVEATRKGWIVFKRIGNVVEVLFPGLVNSQELIWVNEQT